MNIIIRYLCAAVALVLMLAAPPHATSAQSVPGAHSLNFQDADIRVVAQDVARVTGRTFIFDPRVQGTISVVSSQPLSRNEVFNVFVSALRANGYVVTPSGSGAYRISPAEGAARQPGSTGSDRFVTEVFRLRSMDAAAVAEILRPLVSAEGQVLAGGESNVVVVADYADNLARIRGILARLDQDRSNIEIVPLSNTSAREIAGVVSQILGLSERSSFLSVVPVDSSNAIVLRGDPEALTRAMALITDLDSRAGASGGVRVVHLQHANAEQLLPVLQQLVGQVPQPTRSATGAQSSGSQAAAGGETGSAAPAGASLGGAPVAIARYPGANALVISGNAETQRALAEVIRQLDTRRQQVLVEAIVVEVSDDAARQLGVQFLLAGGNGNSVPLVATNYSGTGPNLLAIAGAVAADGNLPDDSPLAQSLRATAVGSLINSAGLIGGIGRQLDNGALFGLILNAVQNDGASNILSTPSILTLDNEEARILVGQEVPITVGEVLGANNSNPFRTIQRQNVGVQLEVRPQVNAGGEITLYLRVEVSSIAGTVSSGFEELILNKREAQTIALADDGDIIVLGGLLQQDERISNSGVPVLGDVPVVGNLFRSTSRQQQRTNLMIFIRPTIIRSPEEARAATARRYNHITNEQRMSAPDGVSSLEDYVRLYLEEQGASAAPTGAEQP